MDNLTIDYTVYPKLMYSTIENALDLNDNEEMFRKLSEIFNVRKDLKDLLEQVESIEREAKKAINNRAKTLYGDSWQAIAGKGYKITRSKAGAVYTRLEDVKVSPKFLKVIKALNTAAIDAELEKTGKLPRGLEFNPDRTEVIKVTIKDE